MKNVVVGRIDGLKRVTVDDSATINEAFRAGNFTRGDNEVIHTIDNDVVEGSESAEDGMSYLYVQKVKSGK